MNREPPMLATWFLQQLMSNSESLIGDLVEQYQHGRSRAWYWRQTGMAIGGNFAAQVSVHVWLSIGVVALAFSLPTVYMRFVSRWTVTLDRVWYPRFFAWLATSAPDRIWQIAIRIHPWAWTGTVAWCALLSAVAWVLVSVRPRQRGLILALFVLSNVCQCIPYLRVAFVDWVHEPENPMWMSNFLWYATFALVAQPLSILFGGRSLIRTSNEPSAVAR